MMSKIAKHFIVWHETDDIWCAAVDNRYARKLTEGQQDMLLTGRSPSEALENLLTSLALTTGRAG